MCLYVASSCEKTLWAEMAAIVADINSKATLPQFAQNSRDPPRSAESCQLGSACPCFPLFHPCGFCRQGLLFVFGGGFAREGIREHSASWRTPSEVRLAPLVTISSASRRALLEDKFSQDLDGQ